MAVGLQTNQCCCDSSSSSSSSSSSISSQIRCDKACVIAELSLCNLDLDELQEVLDLFPDATAGWENISGYGLFKVGSCYAVDTNGTPQDSMKVGLVFMCCGDPANYPIDPLEHCYYEAPGEDLPAGKDLLGNLIEELCFDYPALICSCSHTAASCETGVEWLSCEFSAPVVSVFNGETVYRTNNECCNDDTPREVVV